MSLKTTEAVSGCLGLNMKHTTLMDHTITQLLATLPSAIIFPSANTNHQETETENESITIRATPAAAE